MKRKKKRIEERKAEESIGFSIWMKNLKNAVVAKSCIMGYNKDRKWVGKIEEEKVKIQWHPGFIAAMNLEFAKNRKGLVYEREYNLNTKPLAVDLLVIKKNRKEKLENEIGKLFCGHNLMEYKCPGDRLDINTVYKANAYASLYKIYGGGKRKAEDITVSILREAKPKGLFRYLEEHGGRIENPYRGIYYVYGREVLFATQVIVTGELEKENHIWLTSLSNRLKKQDVQRLLQNVQVLKKDLDKELADSVLEVSVKANLPILEKLKEGDDMCQALLEVMKPEIDKIREDEKRRGMELGEKRGIQLGEKRGKILGLVEAFREVGKSNKEIQKILIQKYGLKEEEALSYL